MKDGYYVIRTYEAGSVGEKTKFWVPGVRGKKLTRKEKSELRKQEQNEHSTEKRLARLINANFGQSDLLLGLDYSPEGMDRLSARARTRGADPETDGEGEWLDAIRLAAEKELELLLRRVSRRLGKAGDELKYITITSDMDGDTGESVQVHHHLIVPAAAKAAFIEKWKELGGVNWETLSGQKDYTPIAAYFARQVRRIPDAKKYRPSRNLIYPKPKDRLAVSDSELRVPKGGQLLHRNEYKPGRPQYIRYVLPAGDGIERRRC